MEFNMAGKAIVRAFLILALIGAAHIIKPFSIKSVTQHMLYSSRSFKFVLPVRLRDKFDHANYLAINLSNGLFEAGKGIQNFAKGTVADFAVAPIKVQPLDEVNKSATKQKSCPKKSAPAKRVIRTERSSAPDLVASVNSDEIIPVELPPAPAIETTHILAPIVQPCVTRFFPARTISVAQARPIELVLALRKKDCDKREAVQGIWITLIEEAKAAKAPARIVEKTKAEKIGLGATECEDRKTEIVTEEFEIEIAEPEEEVVAPQATEELKTSALSEPFEKCSREP